jgi:phosphoenolpyruvate synthase/pyruvate phosphate dikinase
MPSPARAKTRRPERARPTVLSSPAARAPGAVALRGIVASPGRAMGQARVIRHPASSSQLQPGEILVAPSTDPGWTPLFLRAATVVMKVGGYQSHGAIVAREYGIPAVVNIPGLLESVMRQVAPSDADELPVANAASRARA